MDEMLNIFEADHGHETGSAIICMYICTHNKAEVFYVPFALSNALPQ